jgi:hypothetical protein
VITLLLQIHVCYQAGTIQQPMQTCQSIPGLPMHLSHTTAAICFPADVCNVCGLSVHPPLRTAFGFNIHEWQNLSPVNSTMWLWNSSPTAVQPSLTVTISQRTVCEVWEIHIKLWNGAVLYFWWTQSPLAMDGWPFKCPPISEHSTPLAYGSFTHYISP